MKLLYLVMTSKRRKIRVATQGQNKASLPSTLAGQKASITCPPPILHTAGHEAAKHRATGRNQQPRQELQMAHVVCQLPSQVEV